MFVMLALLCLYWRGRESVEVDDALRCRTSGKFVKLTAGVTHYQVAGPEDGPVLVLMTGATLSLWIWDELFQRLAEVGYRVIRYDYYGRGYSDRPKIEYTMDVFHRQLSDLLRALHVDGAVTLISLAFGCPIAADLACRKNGVVKALCFIAPDGFGVPLSSLMKLCLKPIIGPPLFAIFGSKALEARLVEYSDDVVLVEKLRKKYVPELAFKGFKAALASSLQSVPIQNARLLYQEVNETSSVPILVIWGTGDRVTAIPSKADVQHLFSRAEVHLFDGVGHLPHWERPAATVRVIDTFLKREFAASNGRC